jgi:hypothetical protein
METGPKKIYFYDKDEHYYSFTNFSDHKVSLYHLRLFGVSLIMSHRSCITARTTLQASIYFKRWRYEPISKRLCLTILL